MPLNNLSQEEIQSYHQPGSFPEGLDYPEDSLSHSNADMKEVVCATATLVTVLAGVSAVILHYADQI